MLTQRRTRKWSAAACVIACLALTPKSSQASEVRVDLGPSVAATSWRGDYAAGTHLNGAYRWTAVSVDLGLGLAYAPVDKRFVTPLSLGVSFYLPLGQLRGKASGFITHQHEESISAAAENPVGAFFGVGSGIRHRAGGGLGIGLEIPLSRSYAEGKVQSEWYAAVSTDARYLPYGTGPIWYATLHLSIGGSYAM
jgi:hypothetical protein